MSKQRLWGKLFSSLSQRFGNNFEVHLTIVTQGQARFYDANDYDVEYGAGGRKWNRLAVFVGHERGCSFTSSSPTPTGQRGFNDPYINDHDVRMLCNEGRLKEAMDILDDIDQRGAMVNSDTYVCLLERCITMKALKEGRQVHAHILKSGSGLSIAVGTKLANMYFKCGSVVDARKVFDNMPERDVFTWTIMIAGYVQHGQSEEALQLFGQMQDEGVKPDRVTFISVLKACTSVAALEQGMQIHKLICKTKFACNLVLRNTILGMYAKCGKIEQARQVFDGMLEGNVVTWNVMLTGYVQCGQCEKALELYYEMQKRGMKPNKVTFLNILKACTTVRVVKQIHSHIMKSGCQSDISVGSSLVDIYAKCGSTENAREVFDKMPRQNVVSWTSMIAGYAQQGQGDNALELFQQMEQRGIRPNEITFVSVLKACASIASVEQGKQIHAKIIKDRFESDIFVVNALVDMYAKCGCLKLAREVFDKLPKRDAVSWNTMIAGYAQHAKGDEAFELFGQMEAENVKPTKATFVSMLKACSSIASFEKGKQIHAYIIKSGFESDVFVGSALIGMYARYGSINHARKVFNEMPERNVVLWNTMISAYGQHGQGGRALELFWQMEQEGIKPNEVTFVSILKSCASVAALEQGKQIHAQIVKSEYESDIFLGNALVDMYAKCGNIKHARETFDKMAERNMVSWNTMLAGYARQGHAKEVAALVQDMQQAGMKPDSITFLCVLSACSHAGLIDEGLKYFDSMSRDHGITLTDEHYSCMVDLLGHAGRLEEAQDLIKMMPFQSNVVIWTTFLNACRTHGSIKVAEHVATCILKLEPQNIAVFVLLSNVYAAAGRWDDTAKLREILKGNNVMKKLGCSYIEVDHYVHMFMTEDTIHPQMNEIQKELMKLCGRMEAAGYVPDTRFVSHDVDDEQKFFICCHSEKLAVVFGLINTQPGTPIRIVKKLRTCSDSHTVSKLISKIVGREIIVRDANRFHHFKDGVCSCEDYW